MAQLGRAAVSRADGQRAASRGLPRCAGANRAIESHLEASNADPKPFRVYRKPEGILTKGRPWRHSTRSDWSTWKRRTQTRSTSRGVEKAGVFCFGEDEVAEAGDGEPDVTVAGRFDEATIEEVLACLAQAARVGVEPRDDVGSCYGVAV